MSEAAAGFVYCVGVGALLALAARAGESALRGVGRSGRWVWFAAMVMTLTLPGAAWLGLKLWSAPLPVIPEVVAFSLPALEISTPGVETGPGVAAVLPLLWLAASLLVAVRFATGVRRLRIAQRGWRRAEVAGVHVLITDGVGPAVFGLRHASILLPSWALALDDELRSLMLLHEREHLRAGDPRLLAVALALVVVMPWNPLLWYQLHRLRLAVEMDCDARVLRRVPDPRSYGALLLEVGRRRSTPLPVLALSEPITFLERRIRTFTRRAGPYAARRALLLGATAFCIGSIAVCAQDPLSPQREATTEELAVSTGSPQFTPFTVRPQLKNPAQVSAMLRRSYPPLLRDAGIGGTASLWMFIDATGKVERIQLAGTSGHDALDEAALRVAGIMEFEPAKNRDRVVPVWLQIPVQFATSGGDEVEYSNERLPATNVPATPTEPDAPHFTPFTVRPQLTNAAMVSRALQQEYPPLLRNAGIEGTAVMWFYIDETGAVTRTQVNSTSGHAALDEAAQRVAGIMEFKPALNRDQAVSVWVQIPITFSSN